MIRCLLGHKWKLIGEGDLLRNCDNRVVGSFLVLQCERCGNIKRKNFR